jgi:DNA polymerase I-like protein with 3'-5' exonuclease and polymerase domains
MLAAHECFHDWEFFNLKHLAEVLLRKKIKKYRDMVKANETLLDIPFQSVVHYACEDADITFRLYESLSKELHSRGLQAQFESGPMTLVSQLAKLEIQGVPVDESRLQVLRMAAQQKADDARNAIQSLLGRGTNLDSDQEVHAKLLEDSDIAALLRGRRATLASLESLAGSNEKARKIVEYRRARDLVRQIGEVLEHGRGGKVHPLFSQISSRYGQVTSRQPNLFASKVIRDAVDESVRPLYADAARSLNELGRLAMDDQLSSDLVSGNHTTFGQLEDSAGKFLLSLAVGANNAKLARMFLLEHSQVDELRHRMRIRYRDAFLWLEKVRMDACINGFVENDNHRYYVAGLGSANLHKRQKAMNLCIRWLLQY